MCGGCWKNIQNEVVLFFRIKFLSGLVHMLSSVRVGAHFLPLKLRLVLAFIEVEVELEHYK